MRNIQGGGGVRRDAEAEDEDKDGYKGKDDYDHKDNSKINDLWYELQCEDVFDSGTRPLHNHTILIDLCLDYGRTIGAKNFTF